MISVVITNYNGCHILKKCLPENIMKFKELGITDIIVSDDCSTDDSITYLKEQFSELRIAENDQNSGFSQTCNTGAALAKESIILFLNNDMIVKQLNVEMLCKRFKDKNLFGCSPKILRYQEKQLINETPSYGYFKGGWFSTVNSEKMLGQVDGSKPFPILWGCGGAFFVNKEKFNQLNGFDTLFFIGYCEDLDLSYRAWKRGWNIQYEPEGECFHHHQSTMKTLFTCSFLEHIHATNHYLFMWKNLNDFSYIASHVITILIKLITFQIKDIKAIVKALTRIRRVWSYRMTHKLFQKTDHDILNQFQYIHS
ncbi:hypothetical protein DID74_00855 [Candidatus Marinamargulisbacteria bacterium SCGC AG-333-B06]|nr:hypothetical protein DID74_00855 [Candidatus Marinamargulisbacteria bacterium SCGC AG-333-B06]